MTFLSCNSSGTLPARNFLRQSFHDRGFANASFTEQHRIVFCAPAEHLDDALDFVFPANHRIELVLLRQISQITPECTQGRRFYILFPATRAAGGLVRFSFRGREIWIEFLQNFIARPLDIDLEALQHARRYALTFAQQSQQNVFGPDIGMIQRLGFLPGQREHFFHPRRVRNVAHHFCFRPGPHLFLYFHPHRFEIESHLLQNVYRYTLAKFDQAEQKVLGADVIVIEAICFFTRKLQDLLGARGEIIHVSPARNHPSPAPAPLY